MTKPESTIEQLDVLAGTWITEATHPLVDFTVPGLTTYEWLAGRQFLVQRSHNDHQDFPDAITVIGPPEAGDGLVAEYFDSRGVRRTYGALLEDGVLRIWRDHPTFAQRFSASLATNTFVGQWELARTPGDWHEDLRVTYRRDLGVEGKPRF